MILKKILPLLLVVSSVSLTAQNRVFSYSQFQCRNAVQEWGKAENIGQQKVYFSQEQIDLMIDRKYHLTVLSKTDLPDNGAIYLCNDEKKNPVTVMLIDDSKMFVYSNTKRYQINFDPLQVQAMHTLADTD
jgi:hypothetical protein